MTASIPLAFYSAPWEREIAVRVIAHLLIDREGRSDDEAFMLAAQMMDAGEIEAVSRDAKLRKIAREISNEFGFETPP